MKIFAVNSSARGAAQSKTKLLLDHLAAGMKEAGADVEVVDLKDKKVNTCIGCFTCWTKTPGTCVHKDDMSSELFPKFMGADLVVLATPLFHYTMNAELKKFIERTLPIIQPFFAVSGAETYHPLRHPHPGVVMLSVAGFPEISVFDQLSSWANFIYGRPGGLVAEIYRPFAEALLLPAFRKKAQDVFDAVRQAGKEIVQSWKVSPETMSRITQDLTEDSRAFLLGVGNCMWKTCISEGLTPKEMAEAGKIPRADSVESFMSMMELGFNPDKAGKLRAVMQFTFTGDGGQSCYFEIADGAIKAKKGTAEKPDLTISTPFELWMDIMTGKQDGQQMFMQGKYTFKGEMDLLMRMKDLFTA